MTDKGEDDHIAQVSTWNKGLSTTWLPRPRGPTLGRLALKTSRTCIEESMEIQHSCLETPHGQRSLAGYSLWGCEEPDTAE